MLIKGQTVSKEDLAEITHDCYNSMFDIEDNKEEFEEFKNNVENYYFKYSQKRETLEAEYDFELFIDNYILNGSIDLIYRDSDGELVIMDYKYAEYDENHIDGYIKQSYIYALALSKIPEYGKLIKKAIIHFVLSDYEYEVEIDEDVLAQEFENIRIVSENIRNGIFEKEPEKAEECEHCSYRYFCKPKEFARELYD